MSSAEQFTTGLAESAIAAERVVRMRRAIFSIGTATFELMAPDECPGEWLGSAFPGLPDASVGHLHPHHRINAWDGRKREALPPARPWGPTAHEPLGIISGYSDEHYRCAFDIHTSCLIVCDSTYDVSFSWYPDIRALPYWAIASPFRIPLSWMLNGRQMQMVHGAAVSLGGRAALIAGAGGAGKSTTALSCALAGFGYLGDDYCAVEPDAGQVHMIYRTAKILPDTLAMLPALRDRVVNIDQIEEEKGVMFLAPEEFDLVSTAGIAVILLPRLSTDGVVRLSSASRIEAIQAILPSTVGGLMGGGAYTPHAILRLVQSVPAYHLDVSPDFEAVVSTVAAKLEVVA